jgi:FixJ family two-component response regulator
MAAPKPIVYIVDDDPDVRELLSWLVKSIDIEVATYGTATDFLAANRKRRPACLVLDLRMPGMSGTRLMEHLRSEGSDLPILMVTGHADVPIAVRAMRMGVFDFIEKPFSEEEILQRIQDALAANQSALRTTAEQENARRRLELLTPREREVLERVAAGDLNKSVAADLGVSTRSTSSEYARSPRPYACCWPANGVSMRIRSRRRLRDLPRIRGRFRRAPTKP